MKPFYLIILYLCLAFTLQAQNSKTVHVTAAGSLSTMLTQDEMNSITDLTLTGILDARDFRIMRDSMPKLENVDMAEVDIAAYKGLDGTSDQGTEYNYPENEIPCSAFYHNFGYWEPIVTLRSIVLPTSIHAIGDQAFGNCLSLTSVSIPSTVTRIGNSAFMGCSTMADIELPTSLTVIPNYAFNGCLRLPSIIIPALVDSIKSMAFAGCVNLADINIPSSVSYIGYDAFSSCSSLSSINIPSSVRTIDGEAFNNCISLKTIYAGPVHPVDLSNRFYVFEGVDKNSCILHVPYKSKSLYRQANQWKDFKNMVEGKEGMLVSKDLIKLDVDGQSDTLNIFSSFSWTLSSVPAWLTISQREGTGDATIVLSATANTDHKGRQATLIFTAADVSQDIVVQQKGQLNTITIMAGGLSSALTREELDNVTSLKILGAMNDNDFNTLRDQMPVLAYLDISEAAVDSIPADAFHLFVYEANILFEVGKTSLESILLPASITSIGSYAFGACSGLTSITIPSQVSKIGAYAFINCHASITVSDDNKNYSSKDGVLFDKEQSTLIYFPNSIKGSYTIPSTVKTIAYYAFGTNDELTSIRVSPLMENTDMSSFVSLINLSEIFIPDGVKKIVPYYGNNPSFIVDTDNHLFSSADGILFYKGKDALVLFPKSKQGIYVIPSTVTSIKDFAFAGCSNLTSVIIPSSVTSIGGHAFDRCTGLTSMIIPSSVTSILWGAFMGCSNLTSVTIPSSITAIRDAMFRDCIKLTSITIPSSVTTIDEVAFYGCISLTSIILPALVETIGNHAFDNCMGLTTIYSYASTPPLLSSYSMHSGNFINVDKEACVLFVPHGSKQAYSTAYRWSEFKNIVEMPDAVVSLTVEAKEGSSTTTNITSNGSWTATSNQSWLTVSPASGSGNQTLTFTASANIKDTIRTAIVTVISGGLAPQTIIVVQDALTTALEETIQNSPSLTCYPNPFTQKMSIEIINPSLKEVSVEIFSMSGQKIRSLVKAQKGAKITLVWDGTDGQGQKVPAGMYLVKVNERTRKVVRE